MKNSFLNGPIWDQSSQDCAPAHQMSAPCFDQTAKNEVIAWRLDQRDSVTPKKACDVTLQVGGQLSREEVFTTIYKQNIWRDSESVSGRGSSLKATQQLREDMAAFFKRNMIKSIADVPCGDFNWFKAIDYEFDRYVGYDVVKELIDENNRRYGSSSVQFRCANIMQANFEPVDIVLCRDFVIHSSNNDIFAFFANLRRSSISHILLSQYSNCNNRDIATGNRYRPIDFRQDPFNLPEPKELIVENIGHMFDTAKRHACSPQKPLEKYLGYWKTSDIYAALDNNKHYECCVCTRPTKSVETIITRGIEND